MAKIIYVESNESFRLNMEVSFKNHHHQVVMVKYFANVYKEIQNQSFDVVIYNLQQTGNGLFDIQTFKEKVKKVNPKAHVIVCSRTKFDEWPMHYPYIQLPSTERHFLDVLNYWLGLK